MGDGKSFVTVRLRRENRDGKLWPDGSKCPQGRVLIVNTEDAASDTIVPRLTRGGSMTSAIERSRSITRSRTRTDEVVRLNLATRFAAHRGRFSIEHPETQMVVIDPLASFSGERDFNALKRCTRFSDRSKRSRAARGGDDRDCAPQQERHPQGEAPRLAGRPRSSRRLGVPGSFSAIRTRRSPSDGCSSRSSITTAPSDDLGLAFRIESPDPDAVAHIEWLDEAIEGLRRRGAQTSRRTRRRKRDRTNLGGGPSFSRSS